MAGSALIAPGGRWDDAHLEAFRGVGDPPADVVMRAIVSEGRNELAQATAYLGMLVDSDSPPNNPHPALEAFLAETFELPDWADPELIDRGQQRFKDWGPQIILSLFCASLPSAYAAKKGVQVLAQTARLDTDTKRRIMETGQFLVDVLQPGGLDRDGAGRRSIQRVRLMHATVRALVQLRASQEPSSWDEDWGVPINQEDLAGTLQSFAFVVGEPLPKLGIRVARRDADAYIHLWNVIGHQLGLDRRLQPHDLVEAGVLVGQIRRRQQAASPEGLEMGEALVEFLEGQIPGRFADDYIATLIRYLVGAEVGDMIGVPPGAQLPSVVTRGLALLTGHRKGLTGGKSWIQHLSEPVGRELVTAAFGVERLGVERFGARLPFALPEGLADHWRP
jgi:hypothetical protein